MRNLIEVINEMVKVVPSEEYEFLLTLYSLRRSSEFSAPENIYTFWEGLADAISLLVEELEAEEWVQKVVAIFMDEDSVLPVA